MNDAHRRFLASDDWRRWLTSETVPWIDRFDLGDRVLEVGPGPGLTTDVLRERVDRVVAVELDRDLAAALAARLEGTNVTVRDGDATDTGLDPDSFSAVACFSMLHHVPTAAAQDGVFREAHRVLRPGGVFLAVDSLDSEAIRAFHEDDVFVPLDPATVAERLVRAGFGETAVEATEFELRLSAYKPMPAA